MPRPIRRIAQIFAVLGNPELRALWFADWISDVGNFVTFIALAVYVHDLTGTAASIGIALALEALPRVTIGPFVGVLADRMDRRRLMIACNVIRAVLVGALPFTHAAWQAYALATASSAFGPIHRPARSALLAQIVPEGKLVAALAVTETTHQVLHTVGPAIAGLAILAMGARHAFFLDAASFLVAAAFQARIASRGRPQRVQSHVVADVREGYAAVLLNPAVRAYALLNAALALGYGAVVAVLLLYVRQVLHRPEGLYGVVLSVAGAGTVIISLVIAARDERHARTMWPPISLFGIGAFALVAFRPGLPVLLAIALGAGVADGAGIPMAATIAEAMPDDVRGRAYGATEAMWELSSAAGSLAFAWLADPSRLSVVASFAWGAVISTALGAVVLMMGGISAIASFERRRLAAIVAEP